jgi:hypothetical protein
MSKLSDSWTRPTKLNPEMKREVETIEKHHGLPPLYAVGFRKNEVWVARYWRAHAIHRLLYEREPDLPPYGTRRAELVRQWMMDPKHYSTQARSWSAESRVETELLYDSHVQALRESKHDWLELAKWVAETGPAHTLVSLRDSFEAHALEASDLLDLMASRHPHVREFALDLMAHTRSAEKPQIQGVKRQLG